MNTSKVSWMCTAMMVSVAGVIGNAAPPSGQTPLTATLLKTGLYLISGGACNSLLRLSSNGLILVDGQLPGNYHALLAKVKRISDQPIRVLINTDYREAHTGNNSEFRAAGAEILAQENVKRTLEALNANGARTGIPTKTYDRELTLSLGGVQAKVMHFANAHTSGDSIVYFPNLRVIAVGDLYSSNPAPDSLAGGSLLGWGPALEQVLKLDFDTVVPGQGPAVSRADLEALKDRIEALASRTNSTTTR